MYVTWPAPLPNGATGEEMALSFDWNRKHRLLVLAPLFSENNTFRHQLFEIMRQLSLSGIDCYMPDLPGCMTAGETEAEALSLLPDAMAGWLESVLERGLPVPEPSVRPEYSGKVLVRMPRTS